jgi:hypothetical protein
MGMADIAGWILKNDGVTERSTSARDCNGQGYCKFEFQDKFSMLD